MRKQNKKMQDLEKRLMEDEDSVSIDECFQLLSYALELPEPMVRNRYRNIKEGVLKGE